MNGEEPCIYYGFQPDMTRARWEALFHAQDIPGMLAGMQKYPVHPGDTILIEGGMPHAIGAGCFLVEIQEPTDYTIRVERTTPAALPWPTVCAIRGLALKRCSSASTMSRTAARRSTTAGSSNRNGAETAGGSITTLVGYRNTPLFRLDEANVSDTLTVDCPPRGSGIYVLEGAGTERKRPQPASEKDRPALCPRRNGKIYTGCGGSAEVLHFFGLKRNNKFQCKKDLRSLKGCGGLLL
mgnify:CR=1 FL=1